MQNQHQQNFLKRYNKDYYGGALMFLLGTGAIYAGTQYKIGTLSAMGPGYFPVAIGAVLALMGILIALSARTGGATGEDKHQRPEWRGWFCITASIIAFIVLGKHGGLLPATFTVVFIAALGDRQNTLKHAVLLALGVCVVAVVVFWWALHLQFPLFTWS